MIRALLTLLLILPLSARAQDVVAEHDVVDGEPLIVTLKMGAPAPWTGTLLSSGAAAQIISKNKYALLECEAAANKKLHDLEAKRAYGERVLKGEIDALKTYHDGVVKVKNDHIKSLEDIKNPPRETIPFYKTPVAYVTYGALGGALISVLSIHFASN